jgi:hypothetical protein
MKKSETQVAQGELQPAGEQVEALISLTHEELDTVAAGVAPAFVSTFWGVVRMLLGLL